MKRIKFTYEFVKKTFEDEGYTLLSKEYANSHDSLEIICPKGHKYKVRFYSFKNIGTRCPICKKCKKYSYDEVKQIIEDIGYTLVSKNYKNNRTKLDMICDKGHQYSAPLDSILQGHSCGICKKKAKHSYFFVKNYFEEYRYTLLSKKYINSKQLLKVKCPNNHTYKTTFSNFKHGRRCITCFIEFNRGENSYLWRGGVSEKNIPLYDTFAPQLSWCEGVRRDPDNKNILQVRCTNSSCRKWFTPTRTQAKIRVQGLNTKGYGNRFYCSEECKHSCSIFGQIKHPKGFLPKGATARPVQPELRELVLERDNYKCVKCGSTKNLVCHHIKPVKAYPLESADIDVCETLCEKCHKEVHQKAECTTSELRNLC